MSDISSYLTSLYGGTSGSASSLLNTLYGYGGQATASTIPPATALRNAELHETQQVKLTSQQSDVKHAVDAFTKAVTSATSVNQLLSNPAVMKVLLTANGLGDQIAYTALAKKALLSDTTKSGSLANSLTDTRWKAVAKTYDFANKGLSIIQDPKVIATIANGYAEVSWRQSLDKTTPGLSNALTFRAEASSITSVLQILGDKVMRNVVTTALGIPQEIAFQSLEAQEKAITTRLDIKKLQDPKFVESFVQRYLVNASTSASSTATADLSSLAVQAQSLVV